MCQKRKKKNNQDQRTQALSRNFLQSFGIHQPKLPRITSEKKRPSCRVRALTPSFYFFPFYFFPACANVICSATHCHRPSRKIQVSINRSYRCTAPPPLPFVAIS